MEFQEAMKKRRAVNFFDPAKEVTDEEITRLLEIAALAPSSMNFQPWQVAVVRTWRRRKSSCGLPTTKKRS